MVKYQLECGYQGLAEVSDLDTRLPCPDCGKRQRVIAVETRQYHVRCNNCPYGRWTGQSESDAKLLTRKHMAKNPRHVMNIDYQRYPRTRDVVVTLFGARRVKMQIETKASCIWFNPPVNYGKMTGTSETKPEVPF